MLLSEEEYLEAGGQAEDYRTNVGVPEDAPVNYTNSETAKAAFERDNVVASFAAKYDQYPVDAGYDKDFDYNFSMPNEYAGTDKEALYIDAHSEGEAEWITNNIKREEKNIEIMNSANPAAAFAWSMLAAGTSPEAIPTYFIPAAAILSKGMKMRITGAVGTEAAITGVSVAAGEAALHATQTERTVEESVFAIAASVTFASAVTAGVMKGMDFNSTVKQFDNDMATVDANPVIREVAPEDQARHASAAETLEDLPPILEAQLQKKYDAEVEAGRMDQNQADISMQAERAVWAPRMSQLKHPKTYRALGYVSPVVRLATSQSHLARQTTAEILVNPLQQIRNAYGKTLGHSVESLSDAITNQSMVELKRIGDIGFKAYKDAAKKNPNTVKQMSKLEYNTEIAKALRSGDKHTDPIIQSAAKELRGKILAPLEQRMLDMGMLEKDFKGYENVSATDIKELIEAEDLGKYIDKDGNVRTDKLDKLPIPVKETLEAKGKLKSKAQMPVGDESYLHRVYDFQRIENNIESFEADLMNIFRENGLKSIRDEIDAKGQRYHELRSMKDASQNVEGKATKVDYDDKRKADLAVASKSVADAKKAATIHKNRLTSETRKFNKQNSSDWVEYEKILDELEKAEIKVKDAYKKLKDIRGAKQSIDDQVAQAKWDYELAMSSQKARETVLESQLGVAAREVRTAITGGNWVTGTQIQSFKAGVLKERVLDIPSEKISKWLINDTDAILKSHIMGVAPELAMREKFEYKGGKIDDLINDKLRAVQEDYDEMAKVAAPEVARKLHKEQKKVERDMKASFDLVMNRYNMDPAPNSFLSKSAKNLRAFQFITKLGMVTVSAIPDIGNFVMRANMGGVGRYLSNMASMSPAIKAQHDVARAAASAIDLAMNERGNRLFLGDTIDPLTKTTVLDNAVDKTTDIFSKATGMQHWNAALKTATGAIYSDEILKQALKALDGKLDSKTMARFANNGLGVDDLKDIARAFKKQEGESVMDGTHLADVTNWDPALKQKFQIAIMTEVDKTIISPGKGDLPLMSKSFVGKLVFQFKSFALAANNRILLASIDDMSTQKVGGAMAMVGLGAMSYIIRETLKGNEPDLSMERLITEGMERSGLLAHWSDINSMLEKATAGKVHASAALENFDWWEDSGMSSKYASRNMLGSFLGVSAGTVQDIGQVVGAMSSGDWTEADIRAIRRSILFNNLHVLHYGFTKMEEAAGERL